ncbi:MAG: hypothetical protein PHT44_02230 [Candidatus Portnoybacteria bacterium]|nr:hypothetical protein [Candidatus Portnoybacteria bacterium]MDD4982358.1 hypothetical protein [Candidatus Portnoybacteria bacterium]
MDNKKLAVILIVVVLALAGLSAGAYYFGLKKGKDQAGVKLHTAVTCIQDFGLEQKKTDAGVITNPMENLPETNPFNKVKTNPFE